MQNKWIIIAVALLGQVVVSNATAATTGSMTANKTTDWTPYFKSMLAGCDYPYPVDKPLTAYKDSIVKKTTKGDYSVDDEGEITTYTLKQASVFGQPLVKFDYVQGYEWSQLTLYFTDNKFMALRPKFKLPKLIEGYSDVGKNTATGYEVAQGGYVELTFDKTAKTITCESGV
jgi:hypothetical protein